MESFERQVWLISLLLLGLGVLLAVVVYMLTGVLLLVLVFAPPVVAHLLQRWRRRRIPHNGYPLGPV